VTTLTHRLDRTIVIAAPPPAVFNYFTDSARWAAWWGAGSTIDARPGGGVLVRMPGGVEASGTVLEVTPPVRIVFTYGYANGQPIGPGESLVTIELEAAAKGTRLTLSHAFAESAAAARDHHVQGWRYQLSVFANVVANEIHARTPQIVDGWFDAWNETDAGRRAERLAAVASTGVRLRDRISCVDGAGDLVPHIGAAQHFMPGFRMQRSGEPRHCQGVVLADWTATGPDGQVRAQGTNVFTLGADGLIDSVTGFWS
jgi:uncharacterized protein YndB with AHSA1/START domain